MSIWFDKTVTLSAMEHFGIHGMPEYLNMKWIEIGEDFLKLGMPVNEKTKQAYGLLHGGASCALAETIGSLASALVIDTQKFACVGLEINANHVRSATGGYVTATCMPLHLGKTTHIWDIKIHDYLQKMICVSRLTVVIIEKSKLGFAVDAGAYQDISNKREGVL